MTQKKTNYDFIRLHTDTIDGGLIEHGKGDSIYRGAYLKLTVSRKVFKSLGDEAKELNAAVESLAEALRLFGVVFVANAVKAALKEESREEV